MVRNVVLDIGNVMVTYYPDIYIANFFDRKGEIEYYKHICFKGEEWKAGDLGVMNRNEIVEAICRKYPSDAENVRMIMGNCDRMLRASAQNTAILKKLHDAGIGVYYLSNTNVQAFNYMTATHEFFRYMDGGIASFQFGVIKPNREIFELFLKQYEKLADECVFVDDTPQNTEMAGAMGFHTITLKNISDLSDELAKLPELSKIIRG